ncbi:PEP-CTERM sorting domain-containing protein [Aeoliella sp. SH292]|uniref:PEP-CTERM sorting domain-containing protein n=1 Tax=Aeoliella sp. SH292 TaxID=3454464 RepID=UPI003F98F2ED
MTSRMGALSVRACAGIAVGVMGLSSSAWAADYYTSIPYNAVVKINPKGEGATPVGQVFGKEYSHNQVTGADPNTVSLGDHDAAGLPDVSQVVSWDGLPTPLNSGAVDSFDYEPGLLQRQVQLREVDALANRGDALLRQLVRNEATLLFSMTNDTGLGGVKKARVHFEDPDAPNAVQDPLDIWAAIEAPVGPGAGINHHDVWDLDGLEVWGPEPPSHNPRSPSPVREGYVGGGPGVGVPTGDADRFSLDVDSHPTNGFSVWAYDINTGGVAGWVPHVAVVDAVEDLFLGAGVDFTQETRNRIDIDALMSRDVNNPPSPTAGPSWNAGDELVFSLDPILNTEYVDQSGLGVPGPIIDGGEIMHLVRSATGFTISFLNHGGHLWDTAFDVSATFGYEFEDVDAIEAVGVLEGTDITIPEPSSLLLVGLGVAMLGFYRRR